MAFGGRKPYDPTQTSFRPQRIPPQDPWAGYQLGPTATPSQLSAFADLIVELKGKDCLYAVKQLANDAWWRQQCALTYPEHKDDRMILLMQQALALHKKNQDAIAAAEQVDAINFMIDTKMPCKCHRNIRRGGRCNCGHSGEQLALQQALMRFKVDHTLVTPKMREEALVAFRAKKAADAQKVKEELERKQRETKAQAEAIDGKIAQLQANGW